MYVHFRLALTGGGWVGQQDSVKMTLSVTKFDMWVTPNWMKCVISIFLLWLRFFMQIVSHYHQFSSSDIEFVINISPKFSFKYRHITRINGQKLPSDPSFCTTQCASHVDTTWIPRGYHVVRGAHVVPRGYHMVATWSLRGTCHVVFTWKSTWYPRGNYVDFSTWIWPRGTTWLPRGGYVEISLWYLIENPRGIHVVAMWIFPRGFDHVVTTWWLRGIFHVDLTTWWPRGSHVDFETYLGRHKNFVKKLEEKN